MAVTAAAPSVETGSTGAPRSAFPLSPFNSAQVHDFAVVFGATEAAARLGGGGSGGAGGASRPPPKLQGLRPELAS